MLWSQMDKNLKNGIWKEFLNFKASMMGRGAIHLSARKYCKWWRIHELQVSREDGAELLALRGEFCLVQMILDGLSERYKRTRKASGRGFWF